MGHIAEIFTAVKKTLQTYQSAVFSIFLPLKFKCREFFFDGLVAPFHYEYVENVTIFIVGSLSVRDLNFGRAEQNR